MQLARSTRYRGGNRSEIVSASLPIETAVDARTAGRVRTDEWIPSSPMVRFIAFGLRADKNQCGRATRYLATAAL